MRIKYCDFEVPKNKIEERLNEELKGWKIKKIIQIKITKISPKLMRAVFIGEVSDE